MVTVMLACLGMALADPMAIRHGANEQVTVLAGAPVSSASWTAPSAWSFSASWRHMATASLSVGRAQLLPSTTDDPSPWRMGGAVGLALPLWDPAPVLTATPHLQHHRRWNRVERRLGLNSPMAFRLSASPQLRLPLMVEGGVLFDVGSGVVGVVASSGMVYAGAADWSWSSQAAVLLQRPL